ncbi:MAG: sulfite exporter TauE/SafE family protein [Motiliproteus sp.]|nr:sulfite exporter TauE/SafE family protein [Motiliproteus sp.]
MLLLLLTYLILGACAGLIAGLFGLGGGLVIVPVLIFSFEAQGMSPEVLTHVAVGTSLATIIVTSISSIRAHHLRGAVLWPLFSPLAVGICLGAVIGVKTAASLSGPHLQTVIGCFAIIIAVQMGFGFKPKPSRTVPGKPQLGAAGGLIGWASAIFGIGGGSLTVPYLSWHNVKMQQAVGTAAACGLPIAVMGALTNIYEGWGHPDLTEWSLGFVYLPAFFGIILTSALFAKFGAKLAHNLPADILKRCFAVLLLIVGVRFLLAGLGN